jgi:hypothetical protein
MSEEKSNNNQIKTIGVDGSVKLINFSSDCTKWLKKEIKSNEKRPDTGIHCIEQIKFDNSENLSSEPMETDEDQFVQSYFHILATDDEKTKCEFCEKICGRSELDSVYRIKIHNSTNIYLHICKKCISIESVL